MRVSRLTVVLGLFLGTTQAAAALLETACATQCAEVTGAPLNGKTVRGWSYWPCSSQLTTRDPGYIVDEPGE